MKLRNITKVYDQGRKPILVLDDINLEFPNKGLVSLYGRSGEGKSTLLKILGVLDNPTSGEVLYPELINLSEIGFIFQDYNLIEELNILDNILLKDLAINKEFDLIKLDKILEDFNILDLKEKKVSKISIGEKQRATIARALYNDSKIIIADEPTASVDYLNKRIIMDIIKEESKNKLVIVASHDKILMDEYADYKIILKDGNIIYNDIIISEKTESSFINSQEFSNNLSGKTKIKYYFKLSFMHSYKKLKLKNFLSFFISLITFTFLFTLLPISQYDSNKASINQMFIDCNYTSTILTDNKLTLTNYNDIKKNNKNINYYKVSEDMKINMNYGFQSNYSERTKVLIYSNKDDLDKLEFKLISGRYPMNKNEIIITLFQYNLYKKYNYYEMEGNYELEITKYEDILNKTIKSSMYNNLTIVGILDTNYDFNNYERLSDCNIGGELFIERKTLLNETIHNYIIISDDTEKYLDSTRRLNDNQKIQYKYQNNNGTITTLSRSFDNEINNDEVAISYSLATKLGLDLKDISEYEEVHLDNIIRTHAYEKFHLYKNAIQKDLEEGKWWIVNIVGEEELNYTHYYNYIKKYVLYSMPNYYDNQFNLSDIKRISKDTFNKYITLEETLETLEFIIDEKLVELKIIKINLDSSSMDVELKNDLFEHIDNINNQTLYSNVLIHSKSKKEYMNIISDEIILTNEYFLQSKYANVYYNIDNVRNILVYGTISLLFLTLLFIMYNSIINIKYRKNDISILKSQHFSNTKISIILLNEPITIMGLSLIISIISSTIFLKILNTKKLTNLLLFDNIYNINIIQIILLSIILLVGVSLTLLLPLKYFKKQSISELMRGL